tara:strand:+ start:1003 stop:1662 length:660 start_codon:yes stop_codon:yes gene_type:complete
MERTFNFDAEDAPRASGDFQPLAPGTYPGRIAESAYELTKTEVIVNSAGEYVRRIRLYDDGGGYSDEPITQQETASGHRVSSSGAYIYMKLKCDVEGLQWPKTVVLRINVQNLISDQWKGRKIFKQLGKAVGMSGEFVWPEFGDPISALHDKPFLVELTVKKNRKTGKPENDVIAFAPVAARPQQAAPPIWSGKAEVVDRVGTAAPAAKAPFADDDFMF